MHIQTVNHTIRNSNNKEVTPIIVNGEPWFLSTEVAEFLEYKENKYIASAIKRTWAAELREGRDYRKIEGLELMQLKQLFEQVGKKTTSEDCLRARHLLLLSRSGVDIVTMLSKKPEGRSLRNKIADDVLPAIRETGQFKIETTPQLRPPGYYADIAKCHEITYGMLCKVPGIKPDIAAAKVLQSACQLTGMCYETIRQALPAHDGPLASLNATNLGKKVGLGAKAVNRQLEALGMQYKNARGEWELTEAGSKYADALPYATGSHSGYQILWKPSAASLLNS